MYREVGTCGIALKRKDELKKELWCLHQAEGRKGEEDPRLLANRLDACNKRGRGKDVQQFHCNEVWICPRCNKNMQTRLKRNGMQKRAEDLLARHLVPVAIRGSVKWSSSAEENIVEISHAMEAFAKPWLSKAEARTTDVWFGVVLGTRLAIHINFNEERQQWNCHVHGVIWLPNCKEAVIRAIGEMLEKHWLSSAGLHGTCHKDGYFHLKAVTGKTKHNDIKLEAKLETSDPVQQKFESTFRGLVKCLDYQEKVWCFSGAERVLEARRVLREKRIKMALKTGVMHGKANINNASVAKNLSVADIKNYLSNGVVMPKTCRDVRGMLPPMPHQPQSIFPSAKRQDGELVRPINQPKESLDIGIPPHRSDMHAPRYVDITRRTGTWAHFADGVRDLTAPQQRVNTTARVMGIKPVYRNGWKSFCESVKRDDRSWHSSDITRPPSPGKPRMIVFTTRMN